MSEIAHNPADLAREAARLKAAGRPAEAIDLLRQIVRLSPASGVAEHNVAAALGDLGRWREAEPHLKAAFRKGLDAPETWVVDARCQQALGRLGVAETSFREAIRRRPDYYDAHRELAQLVWMRTGDVHEALKALEAVNAKAPSPALSVVKAQTLEFAGKVDAAYALIKQVAAAYPSASSLAVQASQLATELGLGAEALTWAEKALAASPNEMATQMTLAGVLLTTGDAKRAEAICERLCAAFPTNQHAIAMRATAWRLLDDPRYRELYDYDAFVAARTLDTPPGWPNLEAYITDVAAALKSVHAFREHPFNQSLRHGSQAADILQHEHPALQALPQALDGPIRAHLKQLGRGSDPVRARNTGGYAFQGMWSVKLRSSGFHIDHVHPQGWLSSACYVETVKGDGHEGWIKFGQPGLNTKPPLQAEHFVEPKPGMLVLFPSYMWHGTVPFGPDDQGREQSRLTFAFDLVPA